MSSCDLSETPSSFVSSSNFYQNAQQCQTAVNSCYIPLNALFKGAYLLAMEGATDMMWVASGTLDAQLAQTPSNPLFGATMWTQGYKGVVYCNGTIAGIENAPFDEELKFPYLAEAKIIRAYYYYFLTATFGDVPFYLMDVSSDVILEQVAKMGRMPASETRAYFIEELLEIAPKLDQIRTSEVEGNRAGAAMAWMLIAKMAVWDKKWETARDACLELEKIYGDLAQYPYSDVMFRNKNTPESIFEVQHSWSPTGIKLNTNVAAFCTPTRSNVNYFDGVQILEWNDQMTTYGALRPTKYFFQSVHTQGSGDIRWEYNLATHYKGVKFTMSNNLPWLGPKFWNPDMQAAADGNNMKVFRYADAILLLAEAYMELGEDALAVEKLNIVKARAQIVPFGSFGHRDELFEEIVKERARELYGEFTRKYDLVRWGIWYRQTFDYNDYGTLQLNIQPCHEYYPIPDKEVVYSGFALDNKAYEAYGL